MWNQERRTFVFRDGQEITEQFVASNAKDACLATAMWWLGRAIHRLAGLDPWPGSERRN